VLNATTFQTTPQHSSQFPPSAYLFDGMSQSAVVWPCEGWNEQQETVSATASRQLENDRVQELEAGPPA